MLLSNFTDKSKYNNLKQYISYIYIKQKMCSVS